MENQKVLETLTSEDWQKPVSFEQLVVLEILAKDKRGYINALTLQSFMDGENPDYNTVAGKVGSEQIQEFLALVNQDAPHLNEETMERFLRKEIPFGDDYFSLKKFVKENKNFAIWDSVFLNLEELAKYPTKITDFRLPKLAFRPNKHLSRGKLFSALGSEKNIFAKASQLYQAVPFIKFNGKALNHDGQENFFPIVDKNQEIQFLRVWKYNGITNLEMLELDPIEYEFQEGSKIFML